MIEIYGHHFASFAWKAKIAAYARDVPFEFRQVGPDEPENSARMRELSATGQFPALVDGAHEISQSNVVIQYLDRVGDAPPMIPADPDTELRARMLAEVFDDYVALQVTRIVTECFRGDGEKDPRGVADARATLDKAYAWLPGKLSAPWAVGDGFGIADCAAAPALFYADWVHPLPAGPLKDYRARLLAHPAVARVVDEARPYRHLFPLGAPDRD